MMNNKGFTLIEIIFSVAFLSVVSVVMLSLLVASFEVENETDMMDIAIIHVSNELEVVKSMKVRDDFVSVNYYNELWKSVNENNAEFVITLDVKQNDSYDRGLYDINVQVLQVSADNIIIDLNTKHYYHEKE